MAGHALIAMGTVCLIMALLEAWLLVVAMSSDNNPVARCFPGRKDLLRSHIDFLMMSQFLFIFFVLFKVLALSPPTWLVAFICTGAFINPFGFLVRAARPGFQSTPPRPFRMIMSVSFVLTTVGFIGAAWLALGAVWAGGL